MLVPGVSRLFPSLKPFLFTVPTHNTLGDNDHNEKKRCKDKADFQKNEKTHIPVRILSGILYIYIRTHRYNFNRFSVPAVRILVSRSFLLLRRKYLGADVTVALGV